MYNFTVFHFVSMVVMVIAKQHSQWVWNKKNCVTCSQNVRLRYMYVQYSSKVTSHSLDILERMTSAYRARVEQTYLSTLTAHRSRNRSDNRELRHKIQLCRQILSALMISSFESSISCTCSILDTTLEMKLIAITTLEG